MTSELPDKQNDHQASRNVSKPLATTPSHGIFISNIFSLLHPLKTFFFKSEHKGHSAYQEALEVISRGSNAALHPLPPEGASNVLICLLCFRKIFKVFVLQGSTVHYVYLHSKN